MEDLNCVSLPVCYFKRIGELKVLVLFYPSNADSIGKCNDFFVDANFISKNFYWMLINGTTS